MIRIPRFAFGAIAAVVLLVSPALAGSSAQELRTLPVQEGGRVKPFDTYARELLRKLSGKETWEGHDATSVAFSMMADGEAWKQKPILRIEHLDLKKKFDLGERRKMFSFDELLSKRDFLAYTENLRQSGRDDFNDLEKAALEAYGQMIDLDNAATRATPHVVPGMSADSPWLSIGDLASMQNAPFVAGIVTNWAQVQNAALGSDPGQARESLATWTGAVSAQPGWKWVDAKRIDLEVLYNTIHPFRLAWVVYIAAFILFLLAWILKNNLLGFLANIVLWGGFLAHTGGLGIRQYLAGRPPISNLYEATTFIAWGIVFLSILFEMAHRKRIHGTVAAALGSIALVLADTLPIERNLNPLVAVLRSYWMQYHVTTILLSYSALTLAAGLAHFHLAISIFSPERKEIARKASQLLYTAMKIGVTMLAAGIILGAIWASESWGRYWGWDPKETWALITLVGYIAILHGRFAGWLTPYGVSVANVACWGLVLFTYYGVNFFLVGLHSYAGAAAAVKLPPLLIVYLLFEAAVIVGAIWAQKSGRLELRRRTRAAQGGA
jgi:cytochrome c-type biogenesis protein CcsB